jgi:hypothetical protein
MEGAIAVTGSPVTVNAGFGYERGPFDVVERGGKWDWRLGAEAELGRAKLGIAYVASNADFGNSTGIVATAVLSW